MRWDMMGWNERARSQSGGALFMLSSIDCLGLLVCRETLGRPLFFCHVRYSTGCSLAFFCRFWLSRGIAYRENNEAADGCSGDPGNCYRCRSCFFPPFPDGLGLPETHAGDRGPLSDSQRGKAGGGKRNDGGGR